MDPQEKLQRVQFESEYGQRRVDAEIEKLTRQREAEEEQTETQLATEIRRVQDTYKFAAVALPPIPALLVGIVIFFRRSSQERLGVPSSRLR